MGGIIKLMTYFVPIVIGFFFALSLQKAGFGHYHKIVNQFRFKDNTVMKLMMTAISVGLIGIYTLKDLGFIQLDQVSSTYILGNVLGGLLFGVGMAIAGTCPGTLITGIGQGNLDYLFPGLLGFLTGGILFGATYQSVFLKISTIGDYGQKTLSELFHVNHWLFIGLFVLCNGVFYVGSKIAESSKELEKQRPIES